MTINSTTGARWQMLIPKLKLVGGAVKGAGSLTARTVYGALGSTV